jgi:hypothetical protein
VQGEPYPLWAVRQQSVVITRDADECQDEPVERCDAIRLRGGDLGKLRRRSRSQ